MYKTIITLLIATIIIAVTAPPSHALSSNADKFLQACRALDSKFPPEKWDKDVLRDAALEVLNSIENGSYDKWPIDFCIKTLGYTQVPEDIDRILIYEQKMPYSVLRAISGFPHEKAVTTLLKYLNDEKAPKRESAVYGLMDIDFNKMDKGVELHAKVLSRLREARQIEKEKWLREAMDKAINKVDSAKPRAKKK